MKSSKEIGEKMLLDQFRKGDEAALSAIYTKYWETMYLAAYNLIKKKEVCEDIVQDVFVRIWKNREKIQIRVSLRSYLYASTVYMVYDFFRKNRKMVTVELLENFDDEIHQSNPETKIIHKELMELVDTSIDALPGKCKEVFKMSREEQLSHKKIAEKLNISPRTVEGHISKALKILRSSLGNMVSIELVIFIFHDMRP